MIKSFRLIFAICAWTCLILSLICLFLFFINLFTADYSNAIFNGVMATLFIILGQLHVKEKEKLDQKILLKSKD